MTNRRRTGVLLTTMASACADPATVIDIGSGAGGLGSESTGPRRSLPSSPAPSVAGDAAGAQSLPASGALAGAPGDVMFGDADVLTVTLTIEPEVLRELEERGDREQYLPAGASFESGRGTPIVFKRVGVRHKGAESLHHCWDNFGGVRSYAEECAKLSLKVDVDRYEAEARLDGLKQLNLHASMADASRLRELVAYQTFREAGVDAPRARPAQVIVNGVSWGLFIAVEEVDGRYARAHFPAGPDGNLYKEAWPNAATPDAAFAEALRTNEDVADVSDMRAFAEAVTLAAGAHFDAQLAPFVDIAALLRFIAVDRALINWDGIMAFYTPESPHNFYFYHDDGPAPRFHLIPWDLDGTFWPFDPYMHPAQWVTAAPVPDFNARPLDCEPRPIWQPDGSERITPPRCDALLDGLATRHWSRFDQIGRELLAGPLSAERLLARVDDAYTRVAPLIATDPAIDPLRWERAVRELRNIVSERVGSFAAFLDAGLIEEAPPSQPPEPPEPDVPTRDDGLHVGGLTNFEFDVPPSDATPAGLFTFGDPLATVDARWSTDRPLSGQADLSVDFTFTRGPLAYDEWVGVGLSCAESCAGATADARAFSAIVVRLAADVPRRVRVRIASPVYDDELGGVPSEFGQDVAVGPEPQNFALARAGFYYPDWAKAEWTAGQGFAVPDAEELDRVLARFAGLVFAPSPTLDAAGELASASESGRLRIDDVYFAR